MKSTTINRADIVMHYLSLGELFADTDPAFLDKLTEEENNNLWGIDAFENYGYLVINEKTVIVLMDGEASSIHTLKEFEELTRKVLRDHLEEEA